MVETLITTVFVVTILSIIYINFFPLIGEYERREAYDDVDSKYGAFWVKRMIQDSTFDVGKGYRIEESPEHSPTPLSTIELYIINCNSLYANNTSEKVMCDNLWEKLNIKKVFLTRYNITTFKGRMRSDYSDYGWPNIRKETDTEFKNYIAYLPDYSAFQSYNNAKYRVIVEFEHTNIKDGAGKSIPNYKTFATMEVSK